MIDSSTEVQPALICEELLPLPKPRALTKWPGGKRELASAIAGHLPEVYGTYFEPFCGAAALFFALEPEKAVLSDKNSALITTYRALKKDYNSVAEVLAGWKNTSDEYYRVRAFEPSTEAEQAAKLLFLTQLSFNGIYRENLRGIFNVPYGRKEHLKPLSSAYLEGISARLQSATFLNEDFEKAVASAVEGDLVYFDPPYTVAHNNNGFIKYNAHIFSWEDQQRVAKVAQELRERGCHVLISNADHSSIRALYPEFVYKQLRRPSRIAASASYRQSITEALFIS